MTGELGRWGGRSQSGGSNHSNKHDGNETASNYSSLIQTVFLYWNFESNVMYLMFLTHVAMKDFIFCTSIKVLEMKTHAGFSLQKTR